MPNRQASKLVQRVKLNTPLIRLTMVLPGSLAQTVTRYAAGRQFVDNTWRQIFLFSPLPESGGCESCAMRRLAFHLLLQGNLQVHTSTQASSYEQHYLWHGQ